MRWIIAFAHLFFQVFVCLVLGGSWIWVLVGLVFLAVVAFLEPPVRFRTLPELCSTPWACPSCALVLAEMRRR